MPRHSIFESFLSQQGFALFESLPEGAFVPVGDLPAWCKSLWRATAATRIRLAEKSPFLENFLEEATKFWNSGAGEPPESGIWTEPDALGKEVNLEASALWVAGKRILLIHNLGASFLAQRQVLQTARDSLLAHDRLIREIQKNEILLHCIVHDLSQPLTAMRGCFDLLLVETLPPNIAKFVNIGHRESLRQEQMIRSILEAFSSDLSSQQSPGKDSAGPPDLAVAAKQAVEQFSPAFEERGSKLVVDRRIDSSRDWRAIGDAARIERIFGNLLENALRYSPPGSTVTVGVEDRGSSILSFVDDEGPGLPKDASHDRIFALFTKGKDHPGKAGLGLYFCKMTVERWGGTIGADNRPMGGSRFWFRLLRAPKTSAVSGAVSASPPAAAPSPAIAAPPPSVSKAIRAPEKHLRILLADDNETIRDLAVELLRTRGHSVTAVSDGRAAFAAFEKGKFDVILLDQEMPHMNGLETVRAIREKEKSSCAPHAKIISLTGNASPEDARRVQEAGFDTLLPKPFERGALFQLVESGLSAAASGATSAPPAQQAEPARQKEDLAAHLERLTGGNQKLLRSIVTSFLSDSPKKIAAIRRALARKDPDQLASSAHSLKGAVAMFCAEKSVSAARALEAMGRARNLQASEEEFRALTADLACLEHDLRGLIPARLHPGTRHRASRSRSQRKR
jgi:signal transduction histidine kinase/CheY-like chemotaxis protein